MPYGENPDIYALIEAYADQTQGLEPTDRLFQCRQKLERNVAVLFMVEMSASTKGWINEVRRDSLVPLCEFLERLGDRYAIYGFSGHTHMRCELYRVKGCDEPYDGAVHHRISGIRPQDYMRMGAHGGEHPPSHPQATPDGCPHPGPARPRRRPSRRGGRLPGGLRH